ncbi:hypothetical protein [Nocardioides bruguierae]|uniref:Uncharacterized protein n=1 Tax=Nocardioides bruguierae TaxID=2945102 RepID=A0A9X2IGM6_9ACTN|nr:hypothetical protein [Nocardioides bruguierae]MCM0622178.1 hypothetical protein [Nocardioides bruguierae]
MPTYTLAVLLTAWRWLVRFAGASALLTGTLMIANGSSGLGLAVFGAAGFLPYWAWGSWSVLGGALTIIGRTRIIGLWTCTAWWAIWGTILVIGAAMTNTVWYVAGVYLLPTAVLTLLVITEHELRRGARRATRPASA